LAWFVLSPGFVNYHFLGQRLLAGTLAVAAVMWLLERRSSRIDRGTALAAGLAFALGIGLHPSVAFVLVTTALLWLLQSRGDWKLFFLGVGIPAALYAGWLFAMAAWFPNRRNDLLYYPIMPSLDATFPADRSLGEILQSLSPGDWATLARHRIAHLRHYLVTDNWSPAAWTWGRWISLPNVLCWATIPLLIVRRAWRGRERWCVWAIVAPLVFHHLFIGQAEPQFHIGPAPFLALMLLAVATLAAPNAGRVERILRVLIVIELAARLLWPIIAVKLQADRMEPTVLKFRILGEELTPYFAMATLPALCGWRLFRIAQRRGGNA